MQSINSPKGYLFDHTEWVADKNFAVATLSNVNGTVNYSLTFQPYTAYADDYCRVTDDPVMNNKMMYTVPEGTEVTVLATMGSSWTYVEVQTLSGPMRGFVWSKHLYGGNAPAPVYTPQPTPPQNACVSVAPVYNNVYVTAVPQVTATPQPYIVNTFYETASPVSGTPNTYYHEAAQSEWLPAAQEISLLRPT